MNHGRRSDHVSGTVGISICLSGLAATTPFTWRSGGNPCPRRSSHPRTTPAREGFQTLKLLLKLTDNVTLYYTEKHVSVFVYRKLHANRCKPVHPNPNRSWSVTVCLQCPTSEESEVGLSLTSFVSLLCAKGDGHAISKGDVQNVHQLSSMRKQWSW